MREKEKSKSSGRKKEREEELERLRPIEALFSEKSMVDTEGESMHVNLCNQERKRGCGEGRFRGTYGILVVAIVVDDVDVIYMRAEVAFTARVPLADVFVTRTGTRSSIVYG